jgi:hypothetical protein
MRHLIGMKLFEHYNGVRFDRRQIEWLRSQGFELELPDVRFWFEDHLGGKAFAVETSEIPSEAV